MPASLSRRHVLVNALCFCCLTSLARAAGQSRTEHLSPFPTDEVAPGIFVRRGAHEDATSRNAGAIANLGFIVGREAVAVADPGGSLKDGQRLRAAIRAITNRPIRYVVMSHVHPDHIFGAGAFTQDDPEFVGHARLPHALAQRGEYYRARLEQLLGKGSIGPIVMPDRLIEESAELDLGGRKLTLIAHALAHTDCDLSIFDPQTGTLLAADLLFVQRVPSLDGSVKGWLAELATLDGSKARRAVPGHGPSSVNWPAASRELRRYLDTLLRETRQAIAKGVDISAATETVGKSERGRWQLFDEYHGHNVVKAYKELEWE